MGYVGNGYFKIGGYQWIVLNWQMQAGTYKVYIDAAEPYKDVVKDNVQVSDGGTADLETLH